jgi:4,5-DOPA dioxygenase extradiol
MRRFLFTASQLIVITRALLTASSSVSSSRQVCSSSTLSQIRMSSQLQQPYPCAYISHGGGPLPILGQQPDVSKSLKSIVSNLPYKPSAIVVISAHYMSRTGFSVTAARRPPMYYDYGGFPPETYEYQYNAPGHPDLAGRIAQQLNDAGLSCSLDAKRGFDHGVFVPLMLMFPDADIPVVVLSIDESFDPELHIRAGKALSSLRNEGVLFLGSGSSFHNFGYFFARGPKQAEGRQKAQVWNDWLTDTLASDSVSAFMLYLFTCTCNVAEHELLVCRSMTKNVSVD